MAKFFLENNLNTIAPDDYLSVALTCLALTKAGSPAADTLFNTMMSKSTTERKSRDCQYCQNYTFYNVEMKTGKIWGWTWSYNDRQYCQNYNFYNVEMKTGKILGWTWSYNDRS